MPLRLLFLLMGLVTTAMIAAVIYTKVIVPPAERTLTVGEMAARDRVCDVRCSNDTERLKNSGQSDREVLRQHYEDCLAACRVGKPTPKTP